MVCVLKPPRLRWSISESESYYYTKEVLSSLELNTVCEAAYCPNTITCWSSRAVTFMLLGKICTRRCRFCGVRSGIGEEVDQGEPERIAEAARLLDLKYIVLTSVTRDDLTDSGSSQFVKCIRELRRRTPGVRVEVLIPNYLGKDLRVVVEAGPDVLGHNIEVVRRLQPHVRDSQASYDDSLEVLRRSKDINPGIITKSSIMVGIGETKEEVLESMEDLAKVGVDILTIGQYLKPAANKATVHRYVTKEEFFSYRREAEALGFFYVLSGPLVRSSYHAEEAYMAVMRRRTQTELSQCDGESTE